MRLPRGAAWLLALLVAWRADARGTLYNRTYISPADGTPRAYDLYTPSGWDGVRPLPAVLFLHGRGGSRQSFATSGYENGADANGFALIFWQGRWQPEIGAFSTEYVDGKDGSADETDVLACLDDALAAFALDPERVSLAGFSQGGKGALLIGLKHPARFAAVVEGAGPSDAFQGQLWAPDFPDFASAAGGPAAGAQGETLALWYAQSARFLLPNARNLPMALFHGTADTVVPDTTSLFPYRNTHHIADTPGFSDARGVTPTLSELHAADPDGYPFAVTYLDGVGHDEEALLTPAALFGFVAGKSRATRPPRVVARSFEARPGSFYWLRLDRTTPPDGTPAAVTADIAPQSVHLAASGPASITVGLAAAGVDSSRPFTVTVDGGAAFPLRLTGPFPAETRVILDGVVLTGASVPRDGADLVFAITGASPTTISVGPVPSAPVAEDDLLVPALVDATGLNGARFRSEVVLANLSPHAAVLEALLTGRDAPPVRISVAPNATRLYGSAELLALFGLASGAAPLRLRVLAGEPARLFAAARVYNDSGSGSYGLSFPVDQAGISVLVPGDEATFFGGTPAHPSRTNLSLFAPFEAAAVVVTRLAPSGTAAESTRVTLSALTRAQLDDVLTGLPAPARVTVRVEAGRVQAYATVIDNAATNDPFRSPPLLRTAAALHFTIPAVASAPGRNGARFTSDLYLAAPPDATATPVPITVTFLRRGGPPASAAVPVARGGAVALEDVLTELFPGTIPSSGALVLDATSPFEAFAVTRADSAGGPASQDLPSVPRGAEATASTPALFVGLTESPDARSNLVLVGGETASVVGLTFVAEDGVRGAVEVAVGDGEVRQFDSVASLFGGSPVTAGALLVTPRSGRVVASAVRIDNRTNDPAGLAPRPAPGLAGGTAGAP